MLILSKSCRLLHDSYLKLFKPILLSLMTHQPFIAHEGRSESVSYLHNDFSVRKHSANASAASSDELCFNASWYFRNRRWHRFFHKRQTSVLTTELWRCTAGGRFTSCDSCAAKLTTVCVSLLLREPGCFQTGDGPNLLSLKHLKMFCSWFFLQAELHFFQSLL